MRKPKYTTMDMKRQWVKKANINYLLDYLKHNFGYTEELQDSFLDEIYHKIIDELPDSTYEYCKRDSLRQYLKDFKDIYDNQTYYVSIAHWVGMKNDAIAKLLHPPIPSSRIYYLYNRGILGLGYIITIHNQDHLTDKFDDLMNMKRIIIEKPSIPKEKCTITKEAKVSDVKNTPHSKISIRSLRFTNRAISSLSSAGIDYLNELEELSINDIKKLPSIGEKTILNIIQTLKYYDIELKGSTRFLRLHARRVRRKKEREEKHGE